MPMELILLILICCGAHLAVQVGTILMNRYRDRWRNAGRSDDSDQAEEIKK